jgi:hypothetical protein
MKISEKPRLSKRQALISNIEAKRPKGGGARAGAGRKAFEPTDAERRQVEALSGYGVPFEQIAALVRDGIHVDTLRVHFDSELVTGKSKANAQVGKTLFSRAVAGDAACAIWWSKTQMKWVETQHHEVRGPALNINLAWLTGRAVAGSAHTVTLEQPAPALPAGYGPGDGPE